MANWEEFKLRHSKREFAKILRWNTNNPINFVPHPLQIQDWNEKRNMLSMLHSCVISTIQKAESGMNGGQWTSHVSANSGMSGPCPLRPQVGRSLTKQTEKVSSLFVLADIPSPSTLSMVLHQNLRQIQDTELLWSQSLLCGQSYIYNLYLFSHQQFELTKMHIFMLKHPFSRPSVRDVRVECHPLNLRTSGHTLYMLGAKMSAAKLRSMCHPTPSVGWC